MSARWRPSRRIVNRYGRLWRLYRRARGGRRRKRAEELGHWRRRAAAEGTLGNDHYAQLFTGLIGLDRAFYTGKDLLDIGCGPRGSLDWATEARRRVGLDPLVEDYRELGIERHAMEYVAAGAEEMPFEDATFDVVTSLNSLDHVDDLDRAVAEMKRVTRPDGHLVLVTEVGHDPSWSEPQLLDWDVWRLFEPEFEALRVDEYERGPERVYEAVWERRRFDRSQGPARPGVLVALLRRR